MKPPLPVTYNNGVPRHESPINAHHSTLVAQQSRFIGRGFIARYGAGEYASINPWQGGAPHAQSKCEYAFVHRWG
ncbi:hypothetical protein VCR4J5_670062 [Vibrio crassostreae]|uniref:Uncharacterized protein n=1 Tax=Vibrio crassostreae TaxID=246167 RepID=A0ABM9QX60_9VIBR|nr:hypothetical protein VCRA2119O46_150056 [Vibrio crassostreae]CAK2417125.1 hypothetical protein VCRA2116O33_150055 [Vibrio crassostreae]CAK2420510.1 hypothetical protein VCRA2119O54_160056 [Vibrio crassostreae]CAK3263364.1 hypothetical protein VCRA2122O72_150055 [Vibrio crassostreae]CDT51944.1 hypothetical protein VCR4J5_670062 [Vibrio crassostreae]